MKKGVSFWDSLFGEKVKMELLSDDGSVKVSYVTKKWFDRIKSQGRFLPLESRVEDDDGDPMLSRAESLVPTSQTMAMQMWESLRKPFSVLGAVKDEHAHFVLTVAGVFIAATGLNNSHVGDEREDQLMGVVAAQMEAWKPDAIDGFEDCKRFFDSAYDQLKAARHEGRFVAPDAVGKWIVWNMLGRAPQTMAEAEMVRIAGVMVTEMFVDWWQS
jgi:hypothetical protein